MRQFKRGEWSVLRVVATPQGYAFRFGQTHLKILYANDLTRGVEILLVREGRVADKGCTKKVRVAGEEMVLIGDLDTAIPLVFKHHRVARTTGFVPFLSPLWFGNGDNVRVRLNPRRLRHRMDRNERNRQKGAGDRF